MTGLDTNVLVRYLVRDDPEQAKVVVLFSVPKEGAPAR